MKHYCRKLCSNILAAILNDKEIFMKISTLLVLIVVLLVIFIVINAIRKKSQQTYSEDKLDAINHSQYDDGEYFYQSPGTLLDKQYIPIYASYKLCHIPYYKDSSQKWRSIFGLKPLHGTEVKSNAHKVIIERIEGMTNQSQYKVFLDDLHIGTFKKDKLFKENGISRLYPYSFINKLDESFIFENPDRFHTTVIKDSQGNTILSAERTALDYKKNSTTNKRGEQHQIKIINNSQYPDELWLALYIQAGITYQTLDKS